MKRVVKIFILILTAQLTVINVFSQTKQNSFCDTIFVSVDDLTRYTDFLEITTTSKYGDDYLHIKMTPSNLINQIWFILKGYKDNIVKGNIGYILRVFSPVFNINLLYD